MWTGRTSDAPNQAGTPIRTKISSEFRSLPLRRSEQQEQAGGRRPRDQINTSETQTKSETWLQPRYLGPSKRQRGLLHLVELLFLDLGKLAVLTKVEEPGSDGPG
ncbi:MAG: hypothetical protein EBU88_11965 [Acidobacteria bacterium]|nr:hypothetical protein [Acidobacteriota bacterium]